MKLSLGKLVVVGLAAGLLASCGDDAEDAAGEPGSGVNPELAGEGIDFDASTMDAMSIDVVAGGTPPAGDPNTADAEIDMLGGDARQAVAAADEQEATEIADQ